MKESLNLTGNYFPAEFSKHLATVMIWCERKGSWARGGELARPAFSAVIRAICAGESVYLIVSDSSRESAEIALSDVIKKGRVKLLTIPTDDCWARDIAPTFIKRGGSLAGINWNFNGWGGEYNGLYRVVRDDEFASEFLKSVNIPEIDAHPFVLEGGSIHSNGAGRLLVTEECLLSKGRNPNLTKKEIEDTLKKYLGSREVIWLKRGICGDETDGHVDNICAFSDQNTAILAWADEGEQGEICRENYEILKSHGLEVIKLPLPETPVTVTKEELDGLEFEEGEDRREVGERLAASYVNFYICNAGVIVPQFGDKNDKVAVEILARTFKDRKIIPVYARDIITGGGNIHCLTQQIPE